jgi:hypothetical protein
MLTLRHGRMGVAALAALAVAALPACSGSSGGASGAAATKSSAPVTASPKATAALTASSAQLHQTVDQLAQLVDRNVARTGVKGTRTIGFNDAAPCAPGGGPAWPQRWGYGLMLDFGTKDAAPAGQIVVDSLQAQKWSLRTNPNTSKVVDVDATQQATSIRVVADNVPGELSIEAYGGCIAADGSAAAR